MPVDLAHFDAFCGHLTLNNGRPFVLEAFQKRILAGYFAGVTETLALLPKGNGKTTLLGALALHHLCYRPDAACYIAAASRDQATLMFQQADGFVQRSDALQRRVEVKRGYRLIRSLRDQGYIKVLAADAGTADGVLPTLALVDELHRHKTSALLDVFRDGLPKRDGRLLTISTAGSDPLSALGRIRTAALAAGAARRGAYTTARVGDTFVLHEWALQPDDDLDDLALVKRANPASFVTLDSLRSRRDSPSQTRSAWARFAANVWYQAEDAAIPALDWGRAATPALTIPDGADVLLGIDCAWKWDTFAIVPVQIVGRDGARVVGPRIIHPPKDGSLLSDEVPLAAVRDMAARWNVRVVMDPNASGQLFARRLTDELGVEVVQHSQDPSPMSDASMRLAAAVMSGHIEHDGDAELTAQVTGAAAKITASDRWRLVKGPDKRPIDGAVALAMAYRNGTADAEPPPPTPFVLVANDQHPPVHA